MRQHKTVGPTLTYFTPFLRSCVGKKRVCSFMNVSNRLFIVYFCVCREFSLLLLLFFFFSLVLLRRRRSRRRRTELGDNNTNNNYKLLVVVIIVFPSPGCTISPLIISYYDGSWPRLHVEIERNCSGGLSSF